jgi:hypothetical protein
VTFQDLQNQVLTWLDDINGTYFTNAQTTFWLNNAQRECQKQLIQAGEHWYLTTAGTNLVANEDCYSLPADFRVVHKLELLSQGALTDPIIIQKRERIYPVTPIESDLINYGPGFPSGYYLKKNCIVFRAIPDLAYPVLLTYSYMVSDMTLPTSVPDVPVQYQEYIAILATIDGFLRDGRDPSAFLEKKKDYLELMRQDADQRQVDGPRMVVSTDSDCNYFF